MEKSRAGWSNAHGSVRPRCGIRTTDIERRITRGSVDPQAFTGRMSLRGASAKPAPPGSVSYVLSYPEVSMRPSSTSSAQRCTGARRSHAHTPGLSRAISGTSGRFASFSSRPRTRRARPRTRRVVTATPDERENATVANVMIEGSRTGRSFTATAAPGSAVVPSADVSHSGGPRPIPRSEARPTSMTAASTAALPRTAHGNGLGMHA
jgi:hypothetical protein